ncbi:MAG TPA: hypothetical protein VM537_06530 [Anaerolineae bacterium]|nr:hypothetical protein [Anaerolineae bacterium]
MNKKNKNKSIWDVINEAAGMISDRRNKNSLSSSAVVFMSVSLKERYGKMAVDFHKRDISTLDCALPPVDFRNLSLELCGVPVKVGSELPKGSAVFRNTSEDFVRWDDIESVRP